MTAINLQMFDTPNRGNQSSNINQLSPELGNIAYQENDSLLAGKGVSLIYSLNNTVALNYGITGNQSDKISSGYLANILAQQLAKTLADVSAKIYANQSPKFTGNQSGEYFLGQSAKHFANLKRGEFTPFAKEANYPHWQGLIGVTTRGRIEFCQSIKKGNIELLDTIKKERIEFLESIKKGSQSATLGNVDIEYRASENINISLLLWYGKYQFLGSMPNRSNSFRPRVLSQLAKLMFDSFAAASNCSFNSGVMRILNCGDCPSPLGLLSRFTVDKWSPIGLILISIGGHLNTVKPIKSTPPNNATNTIRGLITNDRLFIEVTMSKHNTPVTGRTSLTPNQSYRWLFLALNRSDYTAKPCRIAVTAPNENSARLMLVRDYMLIFAGRLPAIGGKHHA